MFLLVSITEAFSVTQALKMVSHFFIYSDFIFSLINK